MMMGVLKIFLVYVPVCHSYGLPTSCLPQLRTTILQVTEMTIFMMYLFLFPSSGRKTGYKPMTIKNSFLARHLLFFVQTYS